MGPVKNVPAGTTTRPPPALLQAEIALPKGTVQSALPSPTAPYFVTSKSRLGNVGGLEVDGAGQKRPSGHDDAPAAGLVAGRDRPAEGDGTVGLAVADRAVLRHIEVAPGERGRLGGRWGRSKTSQRARRRARRRPCCRPRSPCRRGRYSRPCRRRPRRTSSHRSRAWGTWAAWR